MPDEHDVPHFRLCLHRSIPPPLSEEPSDEELLRLIDGRLDAARRLLLEERLKACPYSADRVAIVMEALRAAGLVLHLV